MNSLPIEPEGPQSEWKVRLPRPERTARTLCAFANGVGGVLWVGVADDGTLVGVHHPDKVLAELKDALAWMDPVPSWNVEQVLREGKTLIRIQVQPLAHGSARVLDRAGEGTAYLRDGSSNRPASRRAAKALESTRRPILGSKERALLMYLVGSAPKSLREIAGHLKMSERRAKRVLVPLLQAGYVHDRLERRYALTARGAKQIGR